MRWIARSIRQARGFPLFGEAPLHPVPAAGGLDLALPNPAQPSAPRPQAGAHGSASPGAVTPSSRALFSAQPSGSGPGLRPNGAAAGSGEPTAKASPESSQKAQPSAEDGVPEIMATLVLDNSVLGAGTASRPDSGPGENLATRTSLDPAGDAAIMLRVAAGDEACFNYLVEKYHRAMIHFLFRMVRNQAVAEELAQEVFLRVYRSRESYRAEAKFTTWLYRIATNLAVNHARDTRHERSAQTIYLDAPDEETGSRPDVADDEPSVEQSMMRNERMAAIRVHVMALPERQRMAVLMHKYEGMDYRQIGEVLKLSESATKSLLFRAYQTLRDKLKNFV